MSALPDNPPSGYLELLIARDDLAAPRPMIDPEGNRVSLVPKGLFGIERIGIRLGVRDVEAHRRFYMEALGLPQGQSADGAMTFLAGDTVLIVEPAADAPDDAAFDGKGWRYITFQVFEVDREHASCWRMAAAGRARRSRSAPRQESRWCAIPTATGSSCRSARRSRDRLSR